MGAKVTFVALCAAILPGVAIADDAIIVAAEARQQAGSYTFSVTLRHGDTGWDDYADGWEVLDSDGNRLGFRELVHPHVNEQPFTRSLSGVEIPKDTATVFIRARTTADGWGAALFEVAIPGS
jgi:hypothetical protein